MKLLQKNNHIVLIFGLGVVGWSIFDHIRKDFHEVASDKLDWSALENCQKTVKAFCKKELPKSAKTVDVIWSAGNTLFSVGEEQAGLDLSFFKKFTALLEKNLTANLPDAKKRYIMLSSAGGLFEGQTSITARSKLEPQRPYADLKLKQEEHIEAQSWLDEYAIVRLSSVYSISNLRSRMGLIPTMVNKSIRQEFLSIYGTEMTLRDYVLDDDIGRYVARIIHKPLPKKVFVVDGKPYSILEIKNMVEAITQKKVYLNYTLMKSNAANNSYSKQIRAEGFEPSDLATNIRLLYYNLLAGSTL